MLKASVAHWAGTLNSGWTHRVSIGRVTNDFTHQLTATTAKSELLKFPSIIIG